VNTPYLSGAPGRVRPGDSPGLTSVIPGFGSRAQWSDDGWLPESECRNKRTMTRSETELVLSLLAYALAVGSSLLMGYLAWRRIRSDRRDFQHPLQREQQRKSVWGWE